MTDKAIVGDLISFYTSCNADRIKLSGVVELDEGLGLVVKVHNHELVDETQVLELKKLVDVVVLERKKESKKVAKLVAISLMTRVIVDEDATDEQIVQEAKKNFQAKLDNNELMDNLESIENDEEIPFGEGHLDVYFQPDLEHPDVHKMIMNGEFNSFDVFKSKEKCKKIFPFARIIEYSGNDIENPNFCDDDWVENL